MVLCFCISSGPVLIDSVQAPIVFEHRCGVSVTVENGDVLGYVERQPMMALVHYGKGKVIAAGLGAGFMLSSIGAGQEDVTERAMNNRELLVRLSSYLLSPTGIAKEPI